MVHVTLGILLHLLHFDITSSEGFFVGDLVRLKGVLFDNIMLIIVFGNSYAPLGIISNDYGYDVVGSDLNMIVRHILEQLLVILKLGVSVLHYVFFHNNLSFC